MQTKDVTDEMIYAAIRKRKTHGGMPQDHLPDVPFKVVMAKMQKMVNQGKLDYGVSLQTAWIEADREKNRTWRDEIERMLPRIPVNIVGFIHAKLHESNYSDFLKPKDE